MHGSKMKHKKRKTKVKSKPKSKKKTVFKKTPTLVPKRDRELAESFHTKKHNLNYYFPMRDLAMPTDAPPGLQEAYSEYSTDKTGAGGIGTDFPQGDIGQPFWFSNIGGNHFPREGFTYKPYDLPIVQLKEQLKGYLDDEDAQMGINFLSAKTTGGRHYFKAKTKFLSDYVETWTNDINLDWLNWQIAKELLAYGNCFVKPRVPIWEAKKQTDFHIIPIESAVRIWWTPDRRPLWYEFRGAEYNGYFRPGEILHFAWNQANGQLYGFGIMAQLTNRVAYLEDTPDGSVLKERESYLDIKHGLQNVTYKVMKRYLPRLMFHAPNAGEDTRDAMRSELRVLHDSEDIVSGIKGLVVQETGAQTRPIDPQVFMDLFQSSIFKAVQTSKGRIAGQSQGPSYANGEESAILDEIGLSQFPVQLARMVTDLIVKPWYEFNRTIDPHIAGGKIAIPWDVGDFEMMFGKQTKKDLEPEQVAQWVQILQAAGQVSPEEIRKIAEYVGVPELTSTEEGGMPIDAPGSIPIMNPNSGQQQPGQQQQQQQPGQQQQAQPMTNQTKVPGSSNKSRFSRA